ncbi:hypothetical protein BDY19DRAFT_998688 [Irpex rosettiformis]|uniref:Uncharacterized protein n=1 Tax=Irpex rosettiformis TaxID=378272 RepID=A0ACB8TMV9_9APHY|nr:hypothetical protein BDY19DRAFT_998688 [Irpex rosettiformis]
MCAHRLPSVPAWTALATRAQSESSEDTTSSYDMQDELAEATAQSSPQTGHKRKEDERRRQSNGPHKKRRLDERINVFNENADDIPASAHAAPVRRALPSRPHPPVPPFTKAPNVAAARRAFEETHGPVPSTSASQHASSPNPRGEGIATQRPVARKSAAIPPPGRRNNHGPPNSGPSRSPVPPPATAPSRMAGNRRSSLSTIGKPNRPEKKQSTVRKRPRAIPRNRSRRRTIAEPIAYIEISDSDEEVPMRPPRSSLRNSRQRARKEIDVIELTDSDEPSVPKQSGISSAPFANAGPLGDQFQFDNIHARSSPLYNRM